MLDLENRLRGQTRKSDSRVRLWNQNQGSDLGVKLQRSDSEVRLRGTDSEIRLKGLTPEVRLRVSYKENKKNVLKSSNVIKRSISRLVHFVHLGNKQKQFHHEKDIYPKDTTKIFT
ncbi:hypothetical protein M0802_003895 [Mischocyttarus mexicanus]|nr:hypothetical protein M0802_003895 [Mischocyttarus mexicanus]